MSCTSQRWLWLCVWLTTIINHTYFRISSFSHLVVCASLWLWLKLYGGEEIEAIIILGGLQDCAKVLKWLRPTLAFEAAGHNWAWTASSSSSSSSSSLLQGTLCRRNFSDFSLSLSLSHASSPLYAESPHLHLQFAADVSSWLHGCFSSHSSPGEQGHHHWGRPRWPFRRSSAAQSGHRCAGTWYAFCMDLIRRHSVMRSGLHRFNLRYDDAWVEEICQVSHSRWSRL